MRRNGDIAWDLAVNVCWNKHQMKFNLSAVPPCSTVNSCFDSCTASLRPGVLPALLQVFDKNVVFSDKEIGSGRLALTRLYNTGTEEVRVPLVTPKGKASGEVQMVVTFRPYH